jgi:DNA (cytosine-5)-methyltransferase 1
MNMLDLFSGIGGFHKGFEQAGYEFDWVGFSDVDKYSTAVYKHKFKNAKELGDVRSIRSKDLPKIDIITFGSPCQDFSQASGSRRGLKGSRSSLIGEAIRLISECRPHIFIWENVKGTFSSNNGEDFWAIIQAFINIGGYRLEWELLNSRWFQVPQNRERIYLIGHLGRGSGRTVFPLREASKSASNKPQSKVNYTIIDKKGNKKNNQSYAATLCGGGHSGGNHSDMDLVKLKQIGTIGEDSEATRVYDANGLSKTIKDGGGMGVKTGLYKVGDLKITTKKRTYDTPKEINDYLKDNKNGKTIKEISDSLNLPKTQVEHYFRSDKSRAIPNPKHWLSLKKLLNFDNTYDKQVTDIYEKEIEFESSRRVYSSNGISKTLDTHEAGLYKLQERIRRLTPIECERLQGFPDNFTSKGIINGEVVSISNSQRYKQLGNAVTVNVVQAIAEKLNKIRR